MTKQDVLDIAELLAKFEIIEKDSELPELKVFCKESTNTLRLLMKQIVKKMDSIQDE